LTQNIAILWQNNYNIGFQENCQFVFRKLVKIKEIKNITLTPGWADAMAKVLRTQKDVEDAGKLLLSKAKKDYERKAAKIKDGDAETGKVAGNLMSAKVNRLALNRVARFFFVQHTKMA
jgi:hypothetical protein